MVVAGSAAIIASDADFADAFDHALGMPATQTWQFEAGRLHLVYGERLRRARAISLARTQLGLALDIFEQMGARPWIAHTNAELRAADVGSAGRRASVPLTPQELRVAGLAASGMTNNQIGLRLAVSRRTVEAHLEQIFPKLGVNSCAGLAEALAKLPPTPVTPGEYATREASDRRTQARTRTDRVVNHPCGTRRCAHPVWRTRRRKIRSAEGCRCGRGTPRRDHAVGGRHRIRRRCHVSYSGLSQILAPLHGRIATLRDTYRQALTIVLGLGSGATSTSLVVANRRGLPQR